jgi:hypothetical protein
MNYCGLGYDNLVDRCQCFAETGCLCLHGIKMLRFQVIIQVINKITVFHDVTTCNLAEYYVSEELSASMFKVEECKV